jgi:hypothetical protein
MMRAEFDIEAFGDEVASEVSALWRKAPEWRPTGPYADHLRPLDPLERREWERLERLGRWERQGRHERTRERVAREQNNPWREQDRWGLRKRVWRERRDRERELLERRERELLEREQELLEQVELHDRWLAELLALEPGLEAWRDEQVERRDQWGLTPEMLEGALQRLRHVAGCRADALLASDDLRATLGAAGRGAARDPIAIARSVTPILVARSNVPLIPALFAAIAIRMARFDNAGAAGANTQEQT